MHPAYSIIVFTTLSGLGYGLAVVLGLGFLDPSLLMTKLAYLTSLALISIGLAASLLHLGNPQRAWRALSQWRSSWLSREGVMAIATFVPLTLSAALAIFGDRHDAILGFITVLGALVTVYCTSMIYASLKTVDSWHTKLTPLCFLLFSLAGGFLVRKRLRGWKWVGRGVAGASVRPPGVSRQDWFGAIAPRRSYPFRRRKRQRVLASSARLDCLSVRMRSTTI